MIPGMTQTSIYLQPATDDVYWRRGVHYSSCYSNNTPQVSTVKSAKRRLSRGTIIEAQQSTHHHRNEYSNSIGHYRYYHTIDSMSTRE